MPALRRIENPVPHWVEAADAASRYLSARREHLVLGAEMRAKREGKRAALGAVALLFANFALLLFFFWISFGIHEAGLSPVVVALVCLAFLGGMSAIFAYLSKTYGHPGA